MKILALASLMVTVLSSSPASAGGQLYYNGPPRQVQVGMDVYVINPGPISSEVANKVISRGVPASSMTYSNGLPLTESVAYKEEQLRRQGYHKSGGHWVKVRNYGIALAPVALAAAAAGVTSESAQASGVRASGTAPAAVRVQGSSNVGTESELDSLEAPTESSVVSAPRRRTAR